MPFVVASGIASAIVSTEVTFANETANRNYILAVNTSGLQGGDTVDVRLYTETISGTGLQLVKEDTYTGAQAIPIKFTDPIPSPHNISARFEQTAGVARTFPFELIAI